MEKYSFLKYNYPERWVSFWHQIDEVVKLEPKNILEIGPGNKFVTNNLKELNLKITTLDVNDLYHPDVIASVLDMPFKDNEFDLILCAEVLEHLPLENFTEALKEIKRVTSNQVILSLPFWGPLIYFKIKIPFLRTIKIFYKFYGFKKHEPGGEHYWEIGKRGYSLKKVRQIINDEFKIREEYLDPDSPYHQFFILEKI